MKRNAVLLSLVLLLGAPTLPPFGYGPVAGALAQQPSSAAPYSLDWYFDTLTRIQESSEETIPATTIDTLYDRLATSPHPEEIAAAAELLLLAGADLEIARIQPLLQSGESHRLYAAIDLLSASKASAATDDLIALLQSPGDAIVLTTVQKLTLRDDARIPEALVLAMNGRSSTVRIGILEALGSMSDRPEVATLIASVEPGEDAATRAAWELSLVRAARENDGSVATDLRQILSTSNNPGIRVAAFRRLAAMGDDETFQVLLSALGNSESEIHQAAILAVGHGDYPTQTTAISSLVPGLSKETQGSLLAALAKRGDTAAWPQVLSILDGGDEDLQSAALAASASLAPAKDIPLLLEFASSRKGILRESAIEALAASKQEGVSEILLGVLVDGKSTDEVTAVAAHAVGRRALTEANASLLALATSETTTVAVSALEALRELAQPDSVSTLVGILASSEQSMVRRRASEALLVCARASGSDVATKAISDGLDGATASAREDLLTILGELGDPTALPVLLKAATDANDPAQRAAIRALGRWPNTLPAEDLAEIVRTSEGAIARLSARSLINLATNTPEESDRWKLIGIAETLPLQREERLLLLSVAQKESSLRALDWLRNRLSDQEIIAEVQSAIVSVSLDLPDTMAAEAEEALKNADAVGENPAVREALAQFSPPLSEDAHILVWDVSNSYRVNGASVSELMDTVFAPERDGSGEFTMVKDGKNPDAPQAMALPALDDNATENTVHYLRTWFRVPAERRAVLEVGSDDSVAIWIDHKEVHRHVGERVFAPGTDRVEVNFAMGTNEMLVKVAQRPGERRFSLRVTEIPGESLAGMMVKGDGMFMMDLPTPPAEGHAAVDPPPPVWSTERWEGDPFFGDYEGLVNRAGVTEPIAAQLIALGNNAFRLRLIDDFDKPGNALATLDSVAQESQLLFEDTEWSIQVEDGTMVGQKRDGSASFQLRQLLRKSPTLGKGAPEGAQVLFDGTDFDAWVGEAGGDVTWTIQEGGVAQVTPQTGGIITRDLFEDFELHLEFRAPYSPGNDHQFNGNSGVFLQMAYEVQILASHGTEGLMNECGAFYNLFPPDVNMCYPPLSWQTYDVTFRAARFDAEGVLSEPARATVLHNGVAVHNDRPLPQTTIPEIPPPQGPRPLYIQDHHNQVQFRNIWIKPL